MTVKQLRDLLYLLPDNHEIRAEAPFGLSYNYEFEPAAVVHEDTRGVVKLELRPAPEKGEDS